MKTTLSSILLVSATTSPTMAVVRPPSAGTDGLNIPYLRMKDLSLPGVANPAEDASWISMSNDMEFLPVDQLPKLPNQHDHSQRNRKLSSEDDNNDENDETEEEEHEDETGAWNEYDPYSVQPFIEGMSEYDEYQQAWRMLGFMIDCNTAAATDDDEGGGGGSKDNEVTEDGCARYVLWAAYVDLDYQGGGIGEYQYWDRTTQQWNDTACEYAEQQSGDSGDQEGDDTSSRCAKMDCHLEDTHFSLLGFFKHRNYDDWMEQLFKHEGMCVWTDEEYAFMKNAREAWPEGCVDSGTTVSVVKDGSTEAVDTALYYNLKPMQNGRIGMGLYTDTQCVEEYPSDTDTIEELLGNFFVNQDNSHSNDGDGDYDYSNDSLADSMDRWNSAFDVWQTCQPCVAYDLENTGGDKYYTDYYYYNGNYYYYGNRRQERRELGGEYYAQGDTFECYDDAGYTNVNQCMKFSAKTTMQTATFRDLSLARAQGSLVKEPLAGYIQDQINLAYRQQRWHNFFSFFFFMGSSIVLCASLYLLYLVAKDSSFSIPYIGFNKKSEGEATVEQSLMGENLII